jgi:hypothetical protein
MWNALPEPGHWRLRYRNGKDGSGVMERFKWHAFEAAALLGSTGDDDDALSYWLERVRRDAPKQYTQAVNITGRPDRADQLHSVEILDICGLSADYCRKCKAYAIQLARAVEHGAQPTSETGSEFWKERHAEFLTNAIRFADLRAEWSANYGTLTLWWGSTPNGDQIPAEVLAAFNAAAQKSLTGLVSSVGKGEREPWWLWLDVMRTRKWRGFQVTRNWPVSKLVWEAGVKIGRPLVVVRRELKLSTFEEEEADYWLEDLALENVFKESADFCEDLARAIELAAAARGSESISPKADKAGATELSADGPVDTERSPQFPKRAVWLKCRLKERDWNKHDLAREGRLDHKTVQRMLDGSNVQDGTLEKVAEGLSMFTKAKRVTELDIPRD